MYQVMFVFTVMMRNGISTTSQLVSFDEPQDAEKVITRITDDYFSSQYVSVEALRMYTL